MRTSIAAPSRVPPRPRVRLPRFRAPLSLAASALVVLAVAGTTSPLQARATGILRCKAPDGTYVYTDKACSAFGATSAPIPGRVLTEIARSERREAELTGADPAALDDDAWRPPSHARPVASGCARTPTQLAMDLGGAINEGDVNRIAESYHWAGMSSADGARTMDRLQTLTGGRVLESQYFNASIGLADAGEWVADAGGSMRGGSAGMLQVVLDDPDAGQRAIDFDVHQYQGCYFVRF